jgi:hydroxymethylpyrimidine pyrophosphatase-like HAD family hydrolase
MIRAAGVGIVVANAREALKEEADVILTHRHDEDALFFVAESYF